MSPVPGLVDLFGSGADSNQVLDAFGIVERGETIKVTIERDAIRGVANRKEPRMAEREVTIGSRVGLHARPAALFVKAASEQSVPVLIAKPGGKPVNARSMLAVLALGAKGGETVVLTADGDGAEGALDTLVALLVQDLDAPESADA